MKQEKDRRGGGGDYLRAAIISNILTQRGHYLRVAINRGMTTII